MNSESDLPTNVGSNDQLGAASEACCICKDRAVSACPGEWEQGCDLGNNEAYVRVHKMTPEERAALNAALGIERQ